MATPSAARSADDLNVLVHTWLRNPGSLFEHKIFTALSLLMRNLTEQFQDYRTYYSLPDQFFNATSVPFSPDQLHHHHHTFVETEDDQQSGVVEPVPGLIFSQVFIYGVLRVILTIVCGLSASWLVNRTVLRNRLIQYALEFVICHAIILPFLPFIGAFYLGIALVRLGIWCHIQMFHRGRRHLVAPEDGFWAYEEQASSSSMIGLYVIKGTCDVNRIKEKVAQVIVSPVAKDRMMKRMISVCGFPVWEDVQKLNVQEHVRIARWPKTDDRWSAKQQQEKVWWTDKDVMDYLSTFQDTPLTQRRPAWEVVVVPNVKMAGSEEPHYVCIFRIHHAMMDGISSANILHQVLADHEFKFTIDPIEGAHKRPGMFVTMCTFLLALLVLPRTGLVNGFLSLDNKYNKYFSPGKTLRGPKHFAWSRPFKMEALKKIKDSSKSSVMSVLLSGLGGSYRKMEHARRKLGYECEDEVDSRVPEFYHALAPVAMLPYPDRSPRNGFSGVALPVAVGEHAGARERLVANHKAFKQMSVGMLDVLGNFMLIGMVGLMPIRMQKYFQGGVHFKMSLSNIPGSDERIRIFGGDSIVEMGAWLPCKFTLGKPTGFVLFKI